MIRGLLVLSSLLLTLFGLSGFSKTEEALRASSSLWLGRYTFAIHWSLLLTAAALFFYLIKFKSVPLVAPLSRATLTCALPFHLSVCLIHSLYVLSDPIPHLKSVFSLRRFFQSSFFSIVQCLFSLFGLILVWSRVSLSLGRGIRNLFVVFCLAQCLILVVSKKIDGKWPYREFTESKRIPFLFLLFFSISMLVFLVLRYAEEKRRISKIKQTMASQKKFS